MDFDTNIIVLLYLLKEEGGGGCVFIYWCVSACPQVYFKSCGWILMIFWREGAT